MRIANLMQRLFFIQRIHLIQSDNYDIFANKLITRLIDNLRSKHVHEGISLSAPLFFTKNYKISIFISMHLV